MYFCHYATSLLLLSISVAHELFSKPTAKTTRRAYRLRRRPTLLRTHRHRRRSTPTRARLTPSRCYAMLYDRRRGARSSSCMTFARDQLLLLLLLLQSVVWTIVSATLQDACGLSARAFFLRRLVDSSAQLSSSAP